MSSQSIDESEWGTLRINPIASGVTLNWFAKRLMDAYNKKGIFSNKGDSLEGLKRALDQRFNGRLKRWPTPSDPLD